MKTSFIINYFITLFMLCSPITAIPLFLNLTRGKDTSKRTRIGVSSGAAVAVILTVATWIGSPLLSFLGISIAAFQCAGGVVVFLLALSMLNAQISPMRHGKDEDDSLQGSVSVVPLAIPVMAGPGALSAVIVAATVNPTIENHFILSACGIAVGIVTASLLSFAIPLEKKLGNTGLNIVTRIGGLILAALSVEILASGIRGLHIW